MNKKNKLVSIVTPSYNSEAYIIDTINSVQNQTYVNWEMIIVDDCSTDNSYAIATKYAEGDMRIKVFKTSKNGGTAIARNLGIKKAKGKYLVFLDSDDMLDNNFIEKQILFFEQRSCVIATAGYRRKASNTCTNFIPPEVTTLKSILKGNPVSCLSTMIDLEKVGKHYFDPELIKVEDFFYWITLLKLGYGPIYGNSDVLATYRILDSSKSRNKFKLIKWMLKVYKKSGLNIFSRYYHLVRWAFYGLNKYKNVR